MSTMSRPGVCSLIGRLPLYLRQELSLQRQYCSAGVPSLGSPGILTEYNRLVVEGKMQADPTQLAAVQALQLLQEGLLARKCDQYNNHTRQHQQQQLKQGQDAEQHRHAASNSGGTGANDSSSSSSSNSSSSLPDSTNSSSSSSSHVQGAYLWGPVGSGKTMLMDMFLKTLPHLPLQDSPTHQPQTPTSTSTTTSSSSSSSSSSSTVISSTGSNGAAVRGILPPSPPDDLWGSLRVEADRLHFHTFMLGVHQQLHQLQQSLPRVVGRSRSGLPVYRHALPPEDPILVVARSAAASTDLLCLDELHVTDVADAMLLSRLFRELMACGVAVVCTSNRPPRDLYKGGLSRRYFEPFIHLVDNRLLQLRVAGGQDYRTAGRLQQQQQQQQQGGPGQGDSTAAGAWILGPDSNQQLQQQWDALADQMRSTVRTAVAAEQAVIDGPMTIPLPFGRSLWVPRAVVAAAVISTIQQDTQQQQQQQQRLEGAYFTVEQLCGNKGSRQSMAVAGALSANDYLALVQSCSHIFVEGLPQLQPNQRDEARRLVTLVDLLYEAHTVSPGSVRLSVSSGVMPHELFLPLLGAAACQGVNPNLGRSGHKLDVKALIQGAKAKAPAEAGGLGSAVAGEDATVGSRLTQSDAAQSAQMAAGVAGSEGRWAGGNAEKQEQRQQQQQQQQQASQPPALLAEEVLMYHRASSRLLELCTVEETASGAGAAT